MTREELFKRKGELTWNLQIMQAQLQEIDKQLVAAYNAPEITNGIKEEVDPISSK